MELTPPEDDYVLKRDYNASTRLTAQHFLWKSTLGYLLHPSIPLPIQPHIADVATGNGCWLLDLAANYNKPCTFDGFDISLDQVPTDHLLAPSTSNIRFHTWDILKEPPSQFVAAFDVVHIRLITVVFRDNDPIPIIESLKRLLKPGGYLQWEEVDNTTCAVLQRNDDEAPVLKKILYQLAGAGKGGWKQDGAKILDQNGFRNAKQFHVEHSRLQARYWSDMYMSTWGEYASKVLESTDEASKLGEEAMKEVRRGATINCPMWIWVAQRC